MRVYCIEEVPKCSFCAEEHEFKVCLKPEGKRLSALFSNCICIFFEGALLIRCTRERQPRRKVSSSDTALKKLISMVLGDNLKNLSISQQALMRLIPHHHYPSTSPGRSSSHTSCVFLWADSLLEDPSAQSTPSQGNPDSQKQTNKLKNPTWLYLNAASKSPRKHGGRCLFNML